MAIVSYAQNFEDVLLNRVFKGKKDGFYIDAGAAHPEILSVTKWFYDLGWRGINIEPTPFFFEKLTQERQRDINLNLAVGSKNEIRTFYESDIQEASSFIYKNTESANLIANNILNDKNKSYNIEVQTIESICERYCNCPIDFLKIDVEGFEKEVLEGCNFKKFRPIIIVIEAIPPFSGISLSSPFIGEDIAYLNENETLKWEQILIDNEYKKVHFDGINCFYVRKEDIYLEKNFSIPVNPYEFTFPNLEIEELQKNQKIIPPVLYNLVENSLSHKSEINDLQEEIKNNQTELTKLRNNLKKYKTLENELSSIKASFEKTKKELDQANARFYKIEYYYKNAVEKLKETQLLALSYREEIYGYKNSFFKRFFSSKKLFKKQIPSILDFSTPPAPETTISSTTIDEVKTPSSDEPLHINLNSELHFTSHDNLSEIINECLEKNGVKFVGEIETILTPNTNVGLFNSPWGCIATASTHVPTWYKKNVLNYVQLFSSPMMKQISANCKCILTFSETLANDLSKLTDKPVKNIMHPLPVSKRKWSPEKYISINPKQIVQPGQSMRCLHAIFMLPKSGLKKTLLSTTCDPEKLNSLLSVEEEELGNEFRKPMLKSVDIVYDDETNIENWYDGSIFFLHLYDASADLIVLKCIADNVPLLVNRLPSMIEYLGVDYPLFYSCYNEAIEKAKDTDLIIQAHEYLKKRSTEHCFSLDYFISSISNFFVKN